MKTLQALALTATLSATPALAQEIIVDNLDGTSETIPFSEFHPDLDMTKHAQQKIEPSLGNPKYLNIVVDTSDKRFVDYLETFQGVTNPEYVQVLFRMMAGTGEYDNVTGSFKYSSYGAFAPESEFMDVYQSTLPLTNECSYAKFREIAEDVWPQVESDMASRNMELSEFDGLVWWLPFENSCTFAGFAYTQPVNIFGEIPLRIAYISIPGARTLEHELGHTRGLRHLSCLDEGGNHVEYCEGGLMGTQKNTYVDEGGNTVPIEWENLIKFATNNQFALGWSNNGDLQAEQDITHSGTYLISNHEGDANLNENPEVLRIEWPDKRGAWFISYEELDGYNPETNIHFRDSVQIGKVTVRSQRQQSTSLGNSFREALLAPGECHVMGTTAKVCNNGYLNAGEEAEVAITRYAPAPRRGTGRRIPNPPQQKLEVGSVSPSNK